MNEKFNYVISTFKMYYNYTALLEIGYGKGSNSKLEIENCNINWDLKQPKVTDTSKVIWKTWKGVQLPFLFDQTDKKEIIDIQNNKITINYDIIASAFYFLSNWQEYASNIKDKYGRFSYKESIQYKLNIADKPIVNYYFDILKSAIEKAYGTKLHHNFWDNKPFAVCITHDIDSCESAWIEGSYRDILKGNLFAPFKLIWKKLFTHDEWFNFDQILKLEKRFNATSSFYFLPVNTKINGITNADYNLKERKFRNVFNAIKESGSGIGIHGGVGTHNHPDELKKQINEVTSDVIGGRFHFLLYDAYSTPEVLNSSGLSYDSSLGFAEQYGFRNGTCLPFYIYDIKNDKPTNVLEIPLVLMDCTLSRYMGIDQHEAIEKVEALISEIVKFNGCFTILWHNTYYSDYKYKGWREIMEKILQICKQKNAQIISAESVYNQVAIK